MSFEYKLQCKKLSNLEIYNLVVNYLKTLPDYKISYVHEKACGFIHDLTENTWGADIELEIKKETIFFSIYIGNIEDILHHLKKIFAERKFLLNVENI